MKDEELTSWQVGAQQSAPLPSIGIHEDIFGRPVFLQDQKRNRAGLRPAPTDAKANSTAKRRRDAGATKRGLRHWANIVASWGAALRNGAGRSSDESRCSAIHKQRPYQEKPRAVSRRRLCAFGPAG